MLTVFISYYGFLGRGGPFLENYHTVIHRINEFNSTYGVFLMGICRIDFHSSNSNRTFNDDFKFLAMVLIVKVHGMSHSFYYIAQLMCTFYMTIALWLSVSNGFCIFLGQTTVKHAVN